MKVIIAGSRDFSDYDLLKSKCDTFLKDIAVSEIVSGTADGADKLGERYALEKGYDLKKFPADWKKYGKKAGYLRNEEMASYADILIAFWDGLSKGTSLMISCAERKGLVIHTILYEMKIDGQAVEQCDRIYLEL